MQLLLDLRDFKRILNLISFEKSPVVDSNDPLHKTAHVSVTRYFLPEQLKNAFCQSQYIFEFDFL